MNITEYHQRRTSSDYDSVERVCSHHVAQAGFECAGLSVKRVSQPAFQGYPLALGYIESSEASAHAALFCYHFAIL